VDHPLEDCRLKVARAKEQFNALHDEVAQLAKDEPCVVQFHVDPQTGDENIEIAQAPHFPRRWSPIVGEIAHSLRSSLDYLIGVLVREAGGEPHRDNAFPISMTEADYLRLGKGGMTYRDRRLRSLPDDIKERIDALQPYQRGDLARADPLLVLRDLSDREKHRAPQTAYVWVNVPGRAFSFPTDDEIGAIKIRLPREGGLDVQAEFKRGRAGTPGGIVFYPKMRMNVEREPSLEVVFGRDDPSNLTGLNDLRDLTGYVDSIIESFDADIQS